MRYKSRLSGPLLDRIDLHIDVPPLDLKSLQDFSAAESSEAILQRVLCARNIQEDRLGQLGTNATMKKAQLTKYARPNASGTKI